MPTARLGILALVEVKDSTIGSNSISGGLASTTGSTVSIVVDHSVSVNHLGSGIIAQGNGAYVTLRDATVAWNAIGLTTVSGGIILSYQNNIIAGNPTPGSTPLSFPLQ